VLAIAGNPDERHDMTILHLDHIQIAAPPECEEAARGFYGEVLGLPEVAKPSQLLSRGGVWFQVGSQQLHVGIEAEFIPARKAHPAFVVDDLDSLADRLKNDGIPVMWDDAVPGLRRFFAADPFGNRLEFLSE